MMRCRRLAKFTLSCVVCGTWAAAVAAAPGIEQIVCPAAIGAASIRVADAPAGWTPFTQFSLDLKNVGISYGPPAALADSVPVSDTTRNGKSVVKWERDFRSGESKWVKCVYGGGGEVTLTRELAPATSECLATYTRRTGQTAIELRCKSGR